MYDPTDSDDTAPRPGTRGDERGSGRLLTLVSGVGMLAALVIVIVLALRIADEPIAGADIFESGQLTVGLQDDRLTSAPVGELPARLDRLKVSGVTMTRIDVPWAQIAPTRPTSPADPDDSAYQWGRTDAVIDGLRDRGIRVVASISQTPGWSNDNKTPEWFGSIDDYGKFIRAFATRYSGDAHGMVDIYEPWSQPNSAAMLMPQWEGAGTEARPVSPTTYVAIYNRARDEVATASPGAVVAAFGLADIEASAGGVGGVGVADFYRAVDRDALEIDLVSQHLAPIQLPTAPSSRIPSIGGIGRFVDLVDTISDRADILVTAVGYSTGPGALTETQQAQTVGQTMSELARSSRVRLAIWASMQDSLARPSGLVRSDSSEKPAWKAFLDTPKSVRSGASP